MLISHLFLTVNIPSFIKTKSTVDCASNTEFRDLLSEYNLLKDVDHINVIKLLGACTQKGTKIM